MLVNRKPIPTIPILPINLPINFAFCMKKNAKQYPIKAIIRDEDKVAAAATIKGIDNIFIIQTGLLWRLNSAIRPRMKNSAADDPRAPPVNKLSLGNEKPSMERLICSILSVFSIKFKNGYRASKLLGIKIIPAIFSKERMATNENDITLINNASSCRPGFFSELLITTNKNRNGSAHWRISNGK